MGLRRRDLIALGGGAVAALPFTPIPWKLTDDASIWTQNWPWIPTPARGERTTRYTACTLCPAACGIRAQAIGPNPVSLAGLANHPISHGALCPIAFGAHQLPYHPARVTTPLHNGSAVALEKALAEIAALAKGKRVAVLDERPGRSASQLMAKCAEKLGGKYYEAPAQETATLDAIAKLAGVPRTQLGVDLENVRTLVSFGAPVLEGWATPGRVLKLWKEGRLEILQVEPALSRTAAMASAWINVRPGAEAALARALAEGATDAAVEATGLTRETIEQLRARVRDRGPALAISGGDLASDAELSIAALNVSLGLSGIVQRASSGTAAATWNEASDGSIDVLFIDHGPAGGTMPWSAIEPKLASGATVVSFSPYRAGVAQRAAWLIPAPAFLESIDDAGTPWDAARPSVTVSPALLSAPPGVSPPNHHLARIAGNPEVDDLEPAIRRRIKALFDSRRGDVFAFTSGETTPVTKFESADKIWECFSGGACWIAPITPARPLRKIAVNWPEQKQPQQAALTLIVRRQPAVLPPLAAKLDRESNVRRAAGRLYIHPAAARDLGIGRGANLLVESAGGTCQMRAEFDANLRRDTCEALASGLAETLRSGAVTLRKA